jgi:DNA-directed RNA polymerase specialized sigma54-like protein
VPKLAEALTILLATGVADGPRQALTGLVRCEDKLSRNRVKRLLKESGLDEGKIADLLNRIDQMRMKRPRSEANRQPGSPMVGQ